jgi:hypothetical protein
MEKVEVAKNGRGIVFLEDAAAGAAGILSLHLAVDFNKNAATARWIGAMPSLSRLHMHGPCPPFAKTAGMSARAISGWARDKWEENVSMSK